ncbi:MAG: biotin/lipoyl-binding protein [Heteroscytonema crispum UTEX LB 1556]
MERNINTLNGRNGHNGHKTAVLDKELVKDLGTLETLTKETSAPVVIPEKQVHPQDEGKKEPHIPAPKGKKPIALILAALGVSAIAASSFGYRYWEYASSHQETDNATVAGHINQVSSKIPGTVSDVLVTDNQLVQQGQLLVKLDKSDYQNKVRITEAALQAAQRQAQAAEAGIALASQTTTAKTVQAQGDVSGALAAISTAQAAVQEAQAGVPAAEADVRAAEAGIPAAQAQVAQANANLQKAQADFNRYNALFQQGAISRQQLDTARAAYDVGVAQKKCSPSGSGTSPSAVSFCKS